MIESRIKRALWAVSILVLIGFGGHSAYEFRQEVEWDGVFRDWATRDRERNEKCAPMSEEDRRLSMCSSSTIYEGISIAVRARRDAAEAAQSSLVISVVCPIALWALFFLIRWIWMGSIRQRPSLVRKPDESTVSSPANPNAQATFVESASVKPIPQLGISQPPNQLQKGLHYVAFSSERDKTAGFVGIAVADKVTAGRIIFLAMFAAACVAQLLGERGGDLWHGVIVQGFVKTCFAAIVPVLLARKNPRRGYIAAVIITCFFFVLPLVVPLH